MPAPARLQPEPLSSPRGYRPEESAPLPSGGLPRTGAPYAEGAAESYYDPVDQDYLREESLARLTQKTTMARTQRTGEWIRKQPVVMTYEGRGRGQLAGSSSHAPIGSYLAERSRTIQSSECCWPTTSS